MSPAAFSSDGPLDVGEGTVIGVVVLGAPDVPEEPPAEGCPDDAGAFSGARDAGPAISSPV